MTIKTNRAHPVDRFAHCTCPAAERIFQVPQNVLLVVTQRRMDRYHQPQRQVFQYTHLQFSL